MGRDQAGANVLAAHGEKLGFCVTSAKAVQHDGHIVSSSLIRMKLGAGELDAANAMLGRPYTVRGSVVRGLGRGGSVLGVPTANLDIPNVALPRPAVYATTIRLPDGRLLPAVTSFGKNPTFHGEKLTLETHILDFSEDLYGKTLEVAFLTELRQEKKFAGPDELMAQLQQDILRRRNSAD